MRKEHTRNTVSTRVIVLFRLEARCAGASCGFYGYVPTRHRQTNNGAELWAALEALQGFWVPKLAILTDSQYLQLGATGRAQH